MIALGLFFTLSAATVGLTDEELTTALRGEVPTRTEAFTSAGGKSTGRGVGAIVIDRSVAEVWTTLARFEDKADYIPRLEKAEVLEKKPSLVRVRMTIDASVTTAVYTALFELDEKLHAIHWKLDMTAIDNTIADVDGGYNVFALDPARTLVVYRTFVDTGRAVPAFIQKYMSRRSIPDLLRAVKRRVESGGLWRRR
ncbi:MAG: hypothetical protein EXR72_22660 [Myxococcales bacterium]|nr:hypothetical protein [Myxococcales bacterium]